MRPPRLAVAAKEDCIGSLKEHDPGRNHATYGMQNSRQFFQLGAFSHIHDQRGAPDLPRLDGQLSEPRNQINWQVVDAIVAEILKRLEHRGLSRSAHAGDDHEFRRLRTLADDRSSGVPRSTFARMARRAARRFLQLHYADSSIDKTRPISDF